MQTLQYETSGQVGVLTLNRPEALNAMTREMVLRLEDLLADIERRGDVRVLLITGAGRAFCAGIDLKEARDDVQDGRPAEGRSDAEDSAESLQRLTRLLMRLPLPTIAALNGLAVGMGSELAVACDIRLASTDAYLWFSEARRGLFQSNGVMYLLPRLVGHSRSIEWMMSTRKIPSQELLDSGLVAKLLPAERFRAAAIDYAASVARNSPLSLRLLKQVSQQAHAATFDEVLRLEVDGMKQTMHSEYAREGLAAFVQNRDPEF